MAAHTNVIPRRVAEFLRQYPPFEYLPEEKLLGLSSQVEVRYYDKGSQLFGKGEPPGSHFYVVNQGSIGLHTTAAAGHELLDRCDEGDVLGVRSMLSGKAYLLTALAEEESLLYAIPVAPFRELMAQSPRVVQYFAAGLASGQTVIREEGPDHPAQLQPEALRLDFDKTISGKRAVISCSPEASIQEAASLMAKRQVGSVIVTGEGQKPRGIVTDRDLREVVSQGIAVSSPVRDVMSSPVRTIADQQQLEEVLIIMMERGIHHLVVTQDGSPDTPVVGIITDHDILLSQGEHPAVLLRALQRSGPEEWPGIRRKAESWLRAHLDHQGSTRLATQSISRINDMLISRAVAHVLERLEAPGPGWSCAWLSLGSEGREEQLLLTDQDNALIYSPGPAEGDWKGFFEQVGVQVTQLLIDAGFAPCPADMMASNPDWCLDLAGWKELFSRWMRNPEPLAVMHTSIFFDFRRITGDPALSTALREHVWTELEQERGFINHLANSALQNPPPLSFFRSFLVEKGGAHKDTFDLKARVMMPLADAARVLALDYRVTENSTVARYETLARLDAAHERLFAEAARAYAFLISLRARSGLQAQDSGRYIPIKQLGKIERQVLRGIFQTVEQMQAVLKSRYQLDYFRR